MIVVKGLAGLAGAGCFALWANKMSDVIKGKNHYEADLSDKTIIITGGNSGIGKATFQELSKRKANIIITGRNVERANKVIKEYLDEVKAKDPKANPQITFEPLDLNSFANIKEFADKIKKNHPKIDVLINNAGQICSEYTLTKGGVEATQSTNNLGPTYLTHHLLPLLEKAPEARIINLSSPTQGGAFKDVPEDKIKDTMTEVFGNNYKNVNFNSWGWYGEVKLAHLLTTKALAAKFEKSRPKIKTCSVHPGFVFTDFMSKCEPWQKKLVDQLSFLIWLGFKNEVDGCQTTLACTMMPFEKLQNGGYYHNCSVTECSKWASKPDIVNHAYKVNIERLEKLTNTKGIFDF